MNKEELKNEIVEKLNNIIDNINLLIDDIEWVHELETMQEIFKCVDSCEDELLSAMDLI